MGSSNLRLGLKAQCSQSVSSRGLAAGTNCKATVFLPRAGQTKLTGSSEGETIHCKERALEVRFGFEGVGRGTFRVPLGKDRAIT